MRILHRLEVMRSVGFSAQSAQPSSVRAASRRMPFVPSSYGRYDLPLARAGLRQRWALGCSAAPAGPLRSRSVWGEAWDCPATLTRSTPGLSRSRSPAPPQCPSRSRQAKGEKEHSANAGYACLEHPHDAVLSPVELTALVDT